MTHFLDNLVNIALNRAPANAAHLSLPSRFAEPSAAASASPASPLATDTSTRTPADRVGAPRAPLSEDALDPPQLTTIDGDRSRRPDRPPLRVAATDHPQASETPLSAKPQVRPVLSASYLGDEHALPTPAASQADGATQVADRPGTTDFSNEHAAGRATSSPISEAAMAGRTAARDQESPIVHVTIDRLEVRSAPAPKPVPDQRRERPQPAVSLADYLRGSGSGRQG